MTLTTQESTALQTRTGTTTTSGTAPKAVAESGFGFADLLDVINPLQHLPVVGTVYRAVTGDELKAPMRIMGGALFGGVLGMIGAAVYSVAEQALGTDPEQEMLAQMGFGGQDEPIMTADAEAEGGMELVTSTDETRPEQVAQAEIPSPEPTIPTLTLDSTPLSEIFTPTIPVPARSAETDDALSRLAVDMRQGAVLGGSANLATNDAATAMAMANIGDPGALLKADRSNSAGRQPVQLAQATASSAKTQAKAALESTHSPTVQDSGALGVPTILPPQAAPEAMMRGLQKYEAMIKARHASGQTGLNRAA